MRYLYYCNSTFQLLNVLNLHWHRRQGFEDITDYAADLILLNTFPGSREIAAIVENEGVFERVYSLDKAYNSGPLHALYTLLDSISPSFYMQDKYAISGNSIADRYDVITAPKYSLIVDQIWRLNKKACLDLIEDGTASYDLVIPFEPTSKRLNKSRKLLGCKDFHDYRHLYLVDTSLYTGINAQRIRAIPAFDETYFEHVRSLFVSFNDYEDKPICWLSQFLNNVEFNRMVDEVLKVLSSYKDDVLFVQHPRKHLDNKYGFAETDGRQIWELQMLKMTDLEEQLFISVHSTASYTAKMLYDKEPYLILFYKLGESWVTETNDDFEEFLKRFKASYRDPDKVMIPETIEEFKECLKIYYEKTGKNK